ncbi:unnamed protein product [Bursaphelenchus okinawaensis]|uniref:Uncharacterized protein n=1 Tax=Bursaphelenchus okinawaensis TaxID=465554 RepID=A0A811LA10_9BILA|nr:unnamed protein product [Bursaphelenchus okinawaensis]CAG9119637.1 unnamed protein product [Bursaphelenchus okinawaensis]
MASSIVSIDVKEFLNKIAKTEDHKNACKHFETFLNPTLKPTLPFVLRNLSFSIKDEELKYKLYTLLYREFGGDTELQDYLKEYVEQLITDPNESLLELVTAMVEECSSEFGKEEKELMKKFFNAQLLHSGAFVRLLNACIVWDHDFVPFAKPVLHEEKNFNQFSDELLECKMLCTARTM